MVKAMSAPFDRVIIGDVVTSDTVISCGYVAVRGETIAAIGEGAPPPASEIVDHSGKADPAGTGRWTYAHVVVHGMAGDRERYEMRGSRRCHDLRRHAV